MKAKNKKSPNEDYIKAIKKADREFELEMNSGRLSQKTKIHKNKKKYNRKDVDFDEYDT